MHHLIGRFIFLENTLFDTFIGDDVVWDKIKRMMRQVYTEYDRAQRFRLRKEAAALFFDYLSRGIERLVDLARKRGVPAVWCRNPMEQVRVDFEKDLEKAYLSAMRNYGGDGQAAGEELAASEG